MFIDIEGIPFNINSIETIAMGHPVRLKEGEPLQYRLFAYLSSGAEVLVFSNVSLAITIARQKEICEGLVAISADSFR